MMLNLQSVSAAYGKAVALENACPHRKLPLSMGRLKGDEVECGYHGLTFNQAGACTRAPGGQRVPKAACVHSYPVEERYGLIWIWMGEAAKADPAKIMNVDHWGDSAWGLNRGDGMTVECNYLYMTDNLLDPSHVAWVHQTSFGNAACADIADPKRLVMSLAQINAPCDLPSKHFEQAMKLAKDPPVELRKVKHEPVEF